MKKLLLMTSLSITATTNIYAADGTISFHGLITEKTCMAATSSSQNLSVLLPKINTNNLASSGNVSGRAPFQINLTQCAPSKVAIYFEPGATTYYNDGRLVNADATGAKNVDLQLLSSDQRVIPIHSMGNKEAQSNYQWLDVTQGAQLNYATQYYATDAATTGALRAMAQYTIVYK